MGAASRYHGQAFVSLDAGQEQQDLQQRTYTGQPEEALYADSTGDEEILAELIDDVEGPEAEVEHVKPRDSLIERTTLWIRNTVEEQGSVTIQGADLDRDDDTRSVASIRLIDLAAEAQEPLLEVSTPSHYSDEMASLPRSQEPDDAVRSSPARQAATASDMPELKDSTVTKAGKLTDAFEHVPSAQISNERPALGQKLTRSFSQRKRLGKTSSKPIKIPGRLKIPQREQEAAAPKVHRESLDLLPALNKPQLPAAEDQPHHNVDARRGSDFDDILLAWSQPGQTVPEPVTPPARGHVGRKVKDWDDSEEEEVASVGVAKRMTLKLRAARDPPTAKQPRSCPSSKIATGAKGTSHTPDTDPEGGKPDAQTPSPGKLFLGIQHASKTRCERYRHLTTHDYFGTVDPEHEQSCSICSD
ncbi:hypothetical protein NDA16_004360 [Ustilago loliicola]|nr:hypothetical protein NDA16_004360 [Ustilago loliicola]